MVAPMASLWGAQRPSPGSGQGFGIQLPAVGSWESWRKSYLSSVFSQSSLRVTYPRSESEDQSCKSLPIWLSLLTWVMAEVLCRVVLFNLEPNYQIMAYVLQQWVWSLIRMWGIQFSGKTLSRAGHSVWANILHSLQTSSQLWNCASDYTR